MRRHLARALRLAVGFAWPLASIAGCFSDAGGATSAASGATSGGTGSDAGSGSSSAGTTSGGATSSGSSSSATSAAATAIETSGGGTGTSGDTSGSTGPEVCTPGMMGDPCQDCVSAACCDDLFACVADPGCACFVGCITNGDDVTLCSAECRVDLQRGVTGQLVLCTNEACGVECQGG